MPDEARCRVVIGETANGELVVCGQTAWHEGRHALFETPEALTVTLSLDELREVEYILDNSFFDGINGVHRKVQDAIERGEAMVAKEEGDGDGIC